MSGLRLYRPSNGTEGEGFMCRFCFQCERDRAFQEDEPGAIGCEILVRTLIHDLGESGYPQEWRYGPDGEPICTAFLPRGAQLPTDADLEHDGQLHL